MAAFPHSVSTGRYTTDQLEGEDCASCGRPFAVGEASRPVRHEARLVDEWNLFAHVICPKVGASK